MYTLSVLQLKRLLVSSPGGMVHLDLDQPLSDGLIEALAAKHKRGRARPEPSAHFTRVEARGTNGRLVRTPQPTVWLGFIPAVSSGVGASHVGASADVGQVLLLEKPWEDVLASLPPPLLRHRYGS